MRTVHDEGSGPVAVLLHGQPGCAEDFSLVRQHLRGRGLRVVSVDRPGYDGATAATGFGGNADALVRLLDDLGVERARVLGLSWAGGAALAFGVAHPDRCEGLLLAASVGAPEAMVRGDRLLQLPVAATVGRVVLPHLAWALEASSGSRLTPAERAEAVRAARLAAAQDGWTAFTVEQRALVHETASLWRSLQPPSFPVRVVHGTRDLYVPVQAGRLLAGRLAAAYHEVDAGHLLHLEVPALLAEQLTLLGSDG